MSLNLTDYVEAMYISVLVFGGNRSEFLYTIMFLSAVFVFFRHNTLSFEFIIYRRRKNII